MLAILLIVSLQCATGCRKKNPQSNQVTITGTILTDCSRTPVKLQKLELYLKSHNTIVGGESGTIGYTTTDPSGYFSLTGRNYGGGGLTITNAADDTRRYRFVYDYEITPRDGDVIDLGTMYIKLEQSTAVKFSRSSNNTSDTLYYGTGTKPIGSAVGADIDGHVYYLAYSRPGEDLPYVRTNRWVWGIGYVQYRQAYDALQALKNEQSPQFFQSFLVHNAICGDDTVRVSL